MGMKGKLGDYRIDNDKFWGIYRGVVEDRFDPEQLGRCRIRVLGIHDESIIVTPIDGVPTIELPWAEPCGSLFEGSVSGNGSWSVPLQGTYVWVFFENGNWMEPRFFASASGKPELPPNPELGFNDPLAEWPRADWLEESDLHRLMRSDKLADTTLLTQKEPRRDIAVEIAIGGEWEEYWPMYQAEYPFNTINYTHGEIYTEIDNTLGNRRWHVYHPSNSYIEIGEIGQMTIRNAESRYDIVDLDRMNHTKANYHRCVNENRSSKVLISEYEEIMENSYRKIHLIDRKDVLDVQDWHIVTAAKLFLDGYRVEFLGDYDEEYISATQTSTVDADVLKWYAANSTRYIGAEDVEIIAASKTKHVMVDEVTIVDVTRTSWVAEVDEILSGDIIHIKAGSEIILEAPTVTLKADVFDDLAAETNIAGLLTWNGIAEGCAAFATTAGLAIPGPPVEVISVVAPVAPAPPAPPAPPPVPAKPPAPPAPPDIPPPPPPPIPPPLEYVDVPPVPDVC